MDGPKVVDDDVEDAQQGDEEHGAVLGLEADGNHDTRKKTDRTHCDTQDTPTIPFKDESEEQEDKKDSTGELKVRSIC